MIESLSAYRLLRQGFGQARDGTDDERFITDSVELALAYAREKGIDGVGAREAPRALRRSPTVRDRPPRGRGSLNR